MDYQSQSCKKLPIYHTLYFSLAILIYHKLVLCVCVCVCCHSISATEHESFGDVQNIDQMNLKDKASFYANYIYYMHKEALLFLKPIIKLTTITFSNTVIENVFSLVN